MSMQITLKPLKGDTFTVEATPEEKIGDLKKKIAEARSEFPAESQKLIYSGKILNDDATIQDSGVSSSGFVVVMVTKAKPPEAAAPAAAATPAAAPAAATPAAAPNPAASAAATMIAGPDMEASITQLCAMGFERDQVQRCLQAAFGNPDRAVEYLMSGIPEGVLPPAGGGPPAAGGAAAAPAGAGGGGGGGGMAPGAFPAMPGPGAGGPRTELPAALAELRENPQFAQLAAMVSQNPQMLAQMLPALQQTHPEIMQAIQSNPQAFMEMLSEAGGGGPGGAAQDPVAAMMAAGGGGGGGAGQMAQLAAALQANPAMLEQMLPEILPEIEANDPAQAQAIRENPQLLLQMLQQAGAMGGGGGGGGGGMPGGGGPVIRLSEEENAAVERLAEMGFDRNAAAQAYLACDKNEELAANFLFDNMGQD